MDGEAPTESTGDKRTILDRRRVLIALRTAEEIVDAPDALSREREIADIGRMLNKLSVRKNTPQKVGCGKNFWYVLHKPNECVALFFAGNDKLLPTVLPSIALPICTDIDHHIDNKDEADKIKVLVDLRSLLQAHGLQVEEVNESLARILAIIARILLATTRSSSEAGHDKRIKDLIHGVVRAGELQYLIDAVNASFPNLWDQLVHYIDAAGTPRYIQPKPAPRVPVTVVQFTKFHRCVVSVSSVSGKPLQSLEELKVLFPECYIDIISVTQAYARFPSKDAATAACVPEFMEGFTIRLLNRLEEADYVQHVERLRQQRFLKIQENKGVKAKEKRLTGSAGGGGGGGGSSVGGGSARVERGERTHLPPPPHDKCVVRTTKQINWTRSDPPVCSEDAGFYFAVFPTREAAHAAIEHQGLQFGNANPDGNVVIMLGASRRHCDKRDFWESQNPTTTVKRQTCDVDHCHSPPRFDKGIRAGGGESAAYAGGGGGAACAALDPSRGMSEKQQLLLQMKVMMKMAEMAGADVADIQNMLREIEEDP